MTYLPANSKSAYLPTNETFPIDDVGLNHKLNYIYSLIANSTNLKDIAQYENVEIVNGQTFFTSGNNQKKRQVFRKVVDFGALPNAGTKSVAHGIPNIATLPDFVLTRIYAAASDPVGFAYIPIPYASPTLANNIELSMDATNVTITTGADRTAFTTCYVVIEYIKG